MQRLEVSGAVRLIYKSLGVKGLRLSERTFLSNATRHLKERCFVWRFQVCSRLSFSYE